jgi:tungstate transport system substrate-binding protein
MSDSSSDSSSGIDRRQLLIGTAATLTAAACGRGSEARPGSDQPPMPPAAPGVVRVASVRTAVEGNLLPALIERFHAAQGLRVELTTGEQVYDRARAGEIDLVVSHYGHRDAEQFVLDGLGEWPRTIFSNQMALLGPPSDPAGVRGEVDLAEAFRRIAATRSPFVVNGIDGVRYLTEILWNAAGRPDRAGWMIDMHTAKETAVTRAAELGAYVFWGLTPFLRTDKQHALALEPLVLADPLLQRLMVSIIVKPGAGRAVNPDGAVAFQNFLLAPATQAAIRDVHYPAKQAVAWVPAGRHNRTAVLPLA